MTARVVIAIIAPLALIVATVPPWAACAGITAAIGASLVRDRFVPGGLTAIAIAVVTAVIGGIAAAPTDGGKALANGAAAACAATGVIAAVIHAASKKGGFP